MTTPEPKHPVPTEEIPQQNLVTPGASHTATDIQVSNAVLDGAKKTADQLLELQHLVREVRWQERLGESTCLYLDSGVPDVSWIVKAPGRARAQAGQRLAVGLPPAALHLFDSQGHALMRKVPDTDLQLPEAA